MNHRVHTLSPAGFVLDEAAQPRAGLGLRTFEAGGADPWRLAGRRPKRRSDLRQVRGGTELVLTQEGADQGRRPIWPVASVCKLSFIRM